jgi:hypothetical protein
MQWKNANVLTCTDKINSFKEKLTLWRARIKKENKGEMVKLTKFADWTKSCQFISTKFVTTE